MTFADSLGAAFEGSALAAGFFAGAFSAAFLGAAEAAGFFALSVIQIITCHHCFLLTQQSITPIIPSLIPVVEKHKIHQSQVN